MTTTRRNLTRIAAVLVIIATVSVAPAASAGCLTEFATCGDCARQNMKEAILELDFWGVAEAQVEGWDCEIDLLHCILYAHHHNYSCGA